LFSRFLVLQIAYLQCSPNKTKLNPQFPDSLWRRAHARNISFQSLCGGRFTVWNLLINPKLCVFRMFCPRTFHESKLFVFLYFYLCFLLKKLVGSQPFNVPSPPCFFFVFFLFFVFKPMTVYGYIQCFNAEAKSIYSPDYQVIYSSMSSETPGCEQGHALQPRPMSI